MRFVMRSLVVLALPVLVFGWLTSARIVLGPPDWDVGFPPALISATPILLIGGMILVAAGSVWLRPVAAPLVAVALYVGVGMLGMSGLYLDASDKLAIWLEVAVTIAGGFAALLFATVAIRSLAGIWFRPDLAMWPGRRAAIVLLLFVALAATPVHDRRDVGLDAGFGGPPAPLPAAQRVLIELTDGTGPTYSGY